MLKVKSHRTPAPDAPLEEQWKMQGINYADTCAKNAVKKYLEAKVADYREWKQDGERIIQHAFKTSALLHEISFLAFNSRKKQVISGPHTVGRWREPWGQCSCAIHSYTLISS